LLRTVHPDADYTTGAEVRRVALPDGSSATLDADSAIAIDFAPGKREVRLLAGRALFTAAPRAPGGPDFTVVTPDASAAALGTRYVVAREAGGTRVAVYEHRVAVHCLVCQDDAALALDAGQEAAVSATGITRFAAPQEPAPDWSQGLLAFNDIPLWRQAHPGAGRNRQAFARLGHRQYRRSQASAGIAAGAGQGRHYRAARPADPALKPIANQ
jgi:transmembrane sensor